MNNGDCMLRKRTVPKPVKHLKQPTYQVDIVDFQKLMKMEC